MILDITKFGNKRNFIINDQLYQFICKTPYTISEIKYHLPYNEYTPYTEQWEKIWIIDRTPLSMPKISQIHLLIIFQKNNTYVFR